jgi:hypothetical protein
MLIVLSFLILDQSRKSPKSLSLFWIVWNGQKTTSLYGTVPLNMREKNSFQEVEFVVGMSESKHVENFKHANGKGMHCKSIEFGVTACRMEKRMIGLPWVRPQDEGRFLGKHFKEDDIVIFDRQRCGSVT